MRTYSIETDRLSIRCYQPKDARLLKQSIDESLDHLRPWMPWAMDEPEELTKKIARVQRYRGEFDLDIDYSMGIFSKDNLVHIGSTGLHTRVGENAREIGYWLGVKHLGKGLASETVKALIKVAFEVEDMARLEIRCDPKNLKSRAIPKKLGFIYQETLQNERTDSYGEEIDSMVWSLLKEDYLNSDLTQFAVKAFDIIDEPIAI